MKYTKKFKELTKKDTNIAGGKGASLGEMFNAEIPVPNGFVVLTDSFEEFLKETNLKEKIDNILKEIKNNKEENFEKISKEIQELILNKNIPKKIKEKIKSEFNQLNTEFVAVRSSATAEDGAENAWAGQLDSFLNVTKKDLNESIKKCWASLFTPRAIFYRFEKNLNKEKISVAVVVQKMVNSKKSGVAFSVNPVSQNPDEIIIEAGFGLGEAIVSGAITPDSYIVSKEKNKILEININEQTKALYRNTKGENEWKELKEEGKVQVLNEKEILELSKLILKIENHYGFACDIEWAQEDNEFYITQSRPVTTLSKKQQKKVKRYTIIANDFHSPLIRNEIFCRIPIFWNKWYNLTMPFIGISSHKNAIDYFVDLKEWMQAKEQFQEKINKNPLLLKEVIDRSLFMGEEMNKFTSQLLNVSLEKWSPDELIHFYEKFCDLQSREYAIGLLLPLIDIHGVSFLESFLSEYLTKKLPNEKVDDAFKVFTSPIKNSFAMDQEMDLLLLADKIFKSEENKKIFLENNSEDIPFKLKENDFDSYKKLKEHVKKHNWVYYVYIGPAFGEVQFVEFLKELLNKKIDPVKEWKRKVEERNSLIKKRNEYLKILKPSEKDKTLIELISVYVLSKPRRKDYQSRSYYHLERFYKEISRRFNLSLELARSLTQKQINNLLLGKKIDLEKIKMQYKHHLCYFNGDEVVTISEKKAQEFIDNNVSEEKIEIENSEIITGNTAFNGKVIGIVKVINDKTTMDKMNNGDILVSVATSPNIVSAMKKAGAIITDEGGLTCHAAIVSRELEVPCVVGTKFASKVLKDGDLVEVDADNGVVRILERKNEKKIKIFSKSFSRPYPITQMEAYYDMLDIFQKDLGYSTKPLFVYNKNKKLVEVYFQQDELKKLFKMMGAYASDEKIFKNIVEDFRYSTKKIMPFLKGKKVKREELKKLYNLFVRFYVGTAYMWVLPDLDNVSDKLKKDALLLRQETEKYSSERDELFINVFSEFYSNIEKDAIFVTLEEVLLKIDEKEILKRVKDRSEGFVYYNRKIINNEEIESFLNENGLVIEVEKKQSDEIEFVVKGITAQLGKVSGIVKIVYVNEDLDKVKEGDILVSPMTRPDFLPAMKKSNAFVTDEGGITCHAAIVSRELGKPCIIGTKNATQILKDGDLVEVDADNGVVRILERKNK